MPGRRLVLAMVIALATAGSSGATEPAGEPRGGALVTYDAFDRVDAPTLGVAESGQPWALFNGGWGISSGAAVFEPGGSIAEATLDSGISKSFKAEADITMSPTWHRANAGLTILHRNHANHVFCKLEVTAGHPRGFMSIGTYVHGTGRSLLGPPSYEDGLGLHNGQTYHVVCRRSGDRIFWSVSGGDLGARVRVHHELTPEELSAFGGATSQGLRSRFAADEDDGGSRWENFEVISTAGSPRVGGHATA